jgi:hypothetical protein
MPSNKQNIVRVLHPSSTTWLYKAADSCWWIKANYQVTTWHIQALLQNLCGDNEMYLQGHDFLIRAISLTECGHSVTKLMVNLSTSKRVNNFGMFFPTLRMQSRTVPCHVFNSPPRHLTDSGQEGFQHNACNNSLNKYNASQVLHMPERPRDSYYSTKQS